jgi:integrative and conjugative element protein (TIGR02256 family)
MLTLLIPPAITKILEEALRKAGNLECGGILLGEHVGTNKFLLHEVTVQGTGSISRFIRKFEDAAKGLKAFFIRHGSEFERFNYLGEWHSHPLYTPEPSAVDHASMREIATDPKVGANFVVLLVVKLSSQQQLVGSAHVYLPFGEVHRATLEIQR